MNLKIKINDIPVSVIIPTYNRGKYIVDAMNSVFKQTYRPVELIVIDDGSTDNTAEIINHWKQSVGHDPCFNLQYVFQNNRGASAARNQGLKIAKGEYIQFLDSDDKLDEAKIANQIKLFSENKTLDLVISSSSYFSDGDLKPFRPHILPSGPVAREQSMTWFFEHDVCIHDPLHRKKTILEIAGFDESLKYGEDTDLHFRLGIKGVKALVLSDILAHVRLHKADRLTHNFRKTDAEYYRSCFTRLFTMDLSPGKKNELKSLVFKRLLRDSKNKLLRRDILDSFKILKIAMAFRQ